MAELSVQVKMCECVKDPSRALLHITCSLLLCTAKSEPSTQQGRADISRSETQQARVPNEESNYAVIICSSKFITITVTQLQSTYK